MLLGPLAAYTAPMPPSTTPPCHWFEVPFAPLEGTPLGLRDDLPDGQATLMELDTGGGPAQVFRLIVLREGQQVTAFVNRCPHFGVPLAAKQVHLIYKPQVSITCNVHYSRFRWSDGVCESGECVGDSLLAVPLDISTQGEVHIGASNRTG